MVTWFSVGLALILLFVLWWLGTKQWSESDPKKLERESLKGLIKGLSESDTPDKELISEFKNKLKNLN